MFLLTKKPLIRYLLPAGIALITAASLDAAATRIAFVDPFATARGNAFTATADNPSAVFYNAAGLGQLEGTQVQGNVFAISLGYEFDGATGSDDMDDDFQDVPSLFISHSFEDAPFSIGFGAYAPFALGSDWGSDASFTAPFPNPVAAVPHKADLQYIKYHLVAAYQLSGTLSLGAGISLDDTDVNLQSNALDFDGDDQVIGWSLSALWQPSEKHSFGLNYQAKTEAKYDGEITGSAILAGTGGMANSLDSKADLVFPESIVFGYAYKPTENWNIEFNLDWTNWDRVDELQLENFPPGLLLLDPTADTYALNWESAFIWELGVTRYFENGWHLSGGYTYVENAVPDQDFLPIVPDSNRHFFAIGLGGDWKRVRWQLTYQQAFASERSVSGNQTSPTIDGDYDLDSQALAFSLNYRF